MCFFRKKKIAVKVKEDRELIESNSKAIEALIILAQNDDVIVNELKSVQEKLKYLVPSDNSKVIDYDKSIKNKIGDLRIILTKYGGEVTKKATAILTDIKLAIADRNTFKSKYDKLTREEVVDAICKLEKDLKNIEDGLIEKQKQIDDLILKGKKETNKEIKLFYAKRINSLKAEREQSVQRAMYLMYNIQLLNKLKSAIDDNQFFKNSAKVSLGNLLADQKGLAKFLNKTLNTRVRAEDVLTSADETFRNVEEVYEKNETIYGMSCDDDALLAMFETEEMVEEEQENYSTESPATKKNTDEE